MPSRILCVHLISIQEALISEFGFLYGYFLLESNNEYASQHITATKSVAPQHSTNATQIKHRGRIQGMNMPGKTCRMPVQKHEKL